MESNRTTDFFELENHLYKLINEMGLFIDLNRYIQDDYIDLDQLAKDIEYKRANI
ncbi:hypothetical protein LC087_19255 (plasmid) [Bacillus carboniphilus]|uniref:Uncharacterized protein n=1 Tax=Bacillus carboniphilus TaxID=86663 RepID=A0ABY9K3M3_9BACI|nr:hypothetical protein [Bacillus carboniphilus]WLR44506.1 hypothetical protein LC087_19255 [Bacillus carboniphilus]